MFRLALRNLRANTTRLISTAVAVIVGTAFVATGLVLTQAISNAVAGNVDSQYGAVDAAVTNALLEGSPDGPGGVDATVLAMVQALPEVQAAAGEIAESTKMLDDDGDSIRSQMLGRTWLSEDVLNPFTVVEGSAPEAAGEVAIDRETAEKASISVGDDIDIATPAGPGSATVVGVTEFGESASVDGGGTVFFSPEEGLALLSAGSDQYNQILVSAATGEDELVDALEAAVPANVEVVAGTEFRDSQLAATESFVDFLRPVLLGFAFLALFVAGFVIYNTFSVVVTQRTKELALIRSIGGTPAQVRRSLLGEGLVLGAIASVVGLLVGTVLSLLVQWILEVVDAPIPSGGLSLTVPIVVITILAGTLITVIAVMIPAFKAGRTKPVEAMKAADVDHSASSAARMWIGGILLGVGLAMLLFSRFVATRAIVLGLGALLLFMGVVIGGPLLAKVFARITRAALGRTLTGRLAADNLVRNPKRTSTTANALVIGLFLVTLVTVAGTAFRDWALAEVAKLSSTDFIVTGQTPIPDEMVVSIEGIDGVDGTAPVRVFPVTDLNGTTALLSGADIDALDATTGLELASGSLDEVKAGEGALATGLEGLVGAADDMPSSTTSEQDPDSGDPGGGPQVEIGDPATIEALSVGDVFTLVDPDGEQVDVPVAAVAEFQLDTLLLGTVVNEELFSRIAGDHPVSQVYIRADQDLIDQVGTDLDDLVGDYTGIEVTPGNFIGQLLSGIIDFLIAAVNGLLGLSVLIALIGIVNTMNLSIHERRRELGMVRALGMASSQVKSMVRTEAFLIGVLGTLIGVVSGVFLGWIIVGSVTDGAVGLDWGRIGLLFGAGVVISVLASLWPARQSMKVQMLEAMAAS